LDLRVLIVPVLVLFLAGASVTVAGTEPRNDCLACHPVHYADQGNCVDCHRGFAGTRRVNIAHEGLIAGRFATFTIAGDPVTETGLNLLKQYGCRRCHLSREQGNRLAANLDLSQRQRTPEELDESIRNPVLFMPQFHFYEEQRVALINGILAGGRQVEMPEREQPLVIHFEGETTTREFAFEKHCGKCHRALTERFGGLGAGLIGPNLSGLFSEFYPARFGRDNQPWTPDNLKKWLKNPRSVDQFARMPPVAVNDADADGIIRELQVVETGHPEKPPLSQ